MTANDTHARHRYGYGTIAVAFPDRLDRIADQLDECLALLTRYGLAEALQPVPGPHHVSTQELRDAAARIRTAADHIPRTSGLLQRQAGTPPAAPGADPAHATAAGS